MNWDALIIGGGPAGSTLACLLARKGWNVALLESKAFPRSKVCGEYLSAANLDLIEALGIATEYHAHAGPDVWRVGLFAGHRSVMAPLHKPSGQRAPNWGRALGRDVLDTLLIQNARSAGAQLFQPCIAESLEKAGDGYLCRTKVTHSDLGTEFAARIVIAAHGSWEPGKLPTQRAAHSPEPRDLFGFKAHLNNADLPAGLMPLLAFPGGYGGLVHSNDGAVSLSCCIRRDVLTGLTRAPSGSAGETLLAYINETCPAARPVLKDAACASKWLSAGPIRPGIRQLYHEGIFRIGNAAGEAHPAIAEGIGMAMQSAQLLAESLPPDASSLSAARVEAAGREYTQRWHQLLAPRIRAARLFANLAMRPVLCGVAALTIQRIPAILALCAAWSGKGVAFSARKAGFPA